MIQNKNLNHKSQIATIFLLGLMVIILSVYKLETVPELWWDEGWTISVARNWVELGHYGRLLNGELHSAGLSGHFPVVASVALSFKVFGIGIWQARLPGVLYMLGALGVMYFLGYQLYGRMIALWTIIALTLMTVSMETNALIIGRQVLGEMPALFFLVSGYAFMVLALQKKVWLVLPMAIMGGIAITSKAQVMPFWLLSLAITFILSLYRQNWKAALVLGVGALGSCFFAEVVGLIQVWMLSGKTVPGEPIEGLYGITALVFDLLTRFRSVRAVLIVGLPTIIGYGYTTWNYFRQIRSKRDSDYQEIATMALLSFGLSWLAWFVLLAHNVGRYFFPSMFIGSIFLAKFLGDMTSQFNLAETVKNTSAVFLNLRITRQTIAALMALLIMAATMSLTIFGLIHEFSQKSDIAAQEVADYVNKSTPEDAFIETYDSELFFLLHRPYHYPPDQVSVEVTRRQDFDPDTPIHYDPLEADPDYLIVGNFSRKGDLYTNVLESGAFRIVKIIPPYEIYERVYE